MNNFRLRYNPLQNANTDIDLALQTPILTTWDLNGVNESIDVFENEKLRNELYKKQNKIQIINPTIKFDYYLNIFKKIL